MNNDGTQAIPKSVLGSVNSFLGAPRSCYYTRPASAASGKMYTLGTYDSILQYLPPSGISPPHLVIADRRLVILCLLLR